MAGISIAGDPGEIVRYLEEFARAAGMRWSRGGAGAWTFASGAFLAVHPREVKILFRAAGGEEGVSVTAEPVVLPWARGKGERIARAWLGAMADHVGARMRGRPASDGPVRLWLASCAGDWTSRALTFARMVASGVVAVAVVFVLATMVGLLVVGRQTAQLERRARIVEAMGYLPLPRPAEVAQVRQSLGGALAAAMMFAVPVAFFLGTVMAVAMMVGEAVGRLATLPNWMALYCLLFGGYALWGLVGPLLSVPFAILMPVGAYAGYTLVWSRQREARRERRPRVRAWAVIAVVAAVALVVFLRATPSREIPRRTAEARDALLLGSRAGKFLAELYYRYNLYLAEAVREPWERVQRTALIRPAAVEWREELEQWGIYTATEGVEPPQVEFVVEAEFADADALAADLRRQSEDSFRARGARDLVGLGFATIHYVGPLWFLALWAAPLVAGAAVCHRRWKRKGSALYLAGVALVAAGVSMARLAAQGEAVRDLAKLRRFSGEDPEPLLSLVRSPHPVVRYRALSAAWDWLEDRGRAHGEWARQLAQAAREALESPDVRVRMWAVGVLGRTLDPANLEALERACRDPELFVRYRAAGALGEYGERGGLETQDHRARARRALRQRMTSDVWYAGQYALRGWREARLGGPGPRREP